MTASASSEFRIGIVIGVAVVAVLHALLLWIPMVWAPAGDWFPFRSSLVINVGWTQLFYLPAMAIYQDWKGNTQRSQGMWLVCLLLFLMTSMCNVLAYPSGTL